MKRTSAMVPILDSLLWPTARGRARPPRTFARLRARAARAAGLATDTEIGDPALIDSFQYLLAWFAGVDRLRSVGWISAVKDVQARMENYFRIQRLHAQHPEIGDEVIERPIIVVGLPRTATTLTHNILAHSAGHRGPLLREYMHTDLARPEAEEQAISRRLARAFDTVHRLAPALISIHPLDPEKVDEEPHLMPHGAHHLARAQMREYEQWLTERDWTGDYDFFKQALQVLQHGRPRARWVLKSPTHLEHLDQLVRLFPVASIVWMHRDPATVLGSICSLVETSTRLHVRRPDLAEIGQMCLRQTSRLVERARDQRPRIQPERIIDVPYDWLTADPHAAVPELYRLLGTRWSQTDAAALESILARPARARAHEYGLGRYGLHPADIDNAFGDYGMFAQMRQPQLARH
ncbi:sulfotransferase family protein [Glycomyces salinus]|uniref:sulfotransferase family protein n=1 Tax=Glycomyces salinus TaxID=980294 RepID=UPI0018EC86D8|nr:sulfotransferase [Glycomyces salinus]